MAAQRQLRAVIVVTVVASALLTVLLGVSATPARGCSCLAASDAEHLRRADAAFAGLVVRREAPPEDGTASSGDPVLWTFAVTSVYKGRVQRSQQVVSTRDSASCGLELSGRGPFLVFASTTAGGRDAAGRAELYHADLCGGTRSVADGAPDLGPTTQPIYVPANWRAVRGPGDERRVRGASAAVVIGVGAGIWWFRRWTRG